MMRNRSQRDGLPARRTTCLTYPELQSLRYIASTTHKSQSALLREAWQRFVESHKADR